MKPEGHGQSIRASSLVFYTQQHQSELAEVAARPWGAYCSTFCPRTLRCSLRQGLGFLLSGPHQGLVIGTLSYRLRNRAPLRLGGGRGALGEAVWGGHMKRG